MRISDWSSDVCSSDLVLVEEQFDVVHVHEPLMPVLPIHVLRHSRTANPDVVNVGTFHARRDGGPRLYSYGRRLLQRWFREIDGNDRKRVGEGKCGSVGVIPGGRRSI